MCTTYLRWASNRQADLDEDPASSASTKDARQYPKWRLRPGGGPNREGPRMQRWGPVYRHLGPIQEVRVYPDVVPSLLQAAIAGRASVAAVSASRASVAATARKIPRVNNIACVIFAIVIAITDYHRRSRYRPLSKHRVKKITCLHVRRYDAGTSDVYRSDLDKFPRLD